jgi:flagellar basal-body rod modification protein FlgD
MTITGTPTAHSAVAASEESSTNSGSASLADKTGTEQTFLQLLVAQLKNQDPMNPADDMQFVSELAQFSQLEQTIAMRQDLDQLAGSGTNQ